DLASPLSDGARVAVITSKSGEPALRLIRHDAAHVLATAVMELYPGVRISIGPPIEDGFYYDFESPHGTVVSEAEFPRLDARLRPLTSGTAGCSPADLAAHLERLEEARARDHRKLGRELDLFMFSELSPGSPFWKPAGTAIWNVLTDLWRSENRARGYEEVRTPILYDVELFRQSGHRRQYRDHMYITAVQKRTSGRKPCNCPAHI